jgi:hypothetical protein
MIPSQNAALALIVFGGLIAAFNWLILGRLHLPGRPGAAAVRQLSGDINGDGRQLERQCIMVVVMRPKRGAIS